jgi:hypothetical protein
MYKTRTRIGIVGFDLSLGRKVSAHTCHIVAAYGGHADTAALLFNNVEGSVKTAFD